MVLDALPLNNNGKIDRGMLLMPKHDTSTDAACLGQTHHRVNTIVSLLQNLVGTALVVTPTTDFAFVGLNSLMFAQLRSLVARNLKVDLSLQQMLKARNSLELSELVTLNSTCSSSSPRTKVIDAVEDSCESYLRKVSLKDMLEKNDLHLTGNIKHFVVDAKSGDFSESLV